MAFEALIPLIATGANMIYDQIWGKSARDTYAEQQAELMQKDLDFKMKSWEEQKQITKEENALKKGAYDFAVKAYEKQEVVRQEERLRQADYLKRGQELLDTPVQGYDQKIVDTNVGMIKQQLDKAKSEQRPGILEGLATRGVRSSGISESALAPIEKSYAEGLSGAISNATLAELLAARTATNQRYSDRLNFYKGVAGMPISGAAGMPGAPNFSPNPALPDNSNYLQSQLEQYALPLYNSRVTAGNINSLLSAAGYAYNNYGGGGGNADINTNSVGSNLNLNGMSNPNANPYEDYSWLTSRSGRN